MQRLWVALVSAVSLAGCVGGSTAAPLPAATPAVAPTPTPTPTPVGTPTPGPLSAAPPTLAFNSVGVTQAVTVTDPSYTGIYTVSGCAGIATLSAVTNGKFNVTSVAVGTCTLTISDTFSHQVTIAVSVTTLSVPVN